MSVPIQVTPRSLDPLQSLAPQLPIDAASDHMGGLVMSQLFGRYYNLTRAGLVFVSGLAGSAIPLVTTSAGFCWWNPASSGVNLVPIRWSMAYSGGGGGQVTGVNNSFVIKVLFAGDEAMTNLNGNIATFTPLVYDSTDNSMSKNRYVSAGNIIGTGNVSRGGRPSRIRIGSAASIASGALGVVHYLNISQQAVATTGTSVIGPLFEDFDGTLIFAPGTFACISTDGAASGDKWDVQLIWAEVPL